MGSVMMIVCVMVAMAGLASRVQANYHVSDFHPISGQQFFVACPSNYYNCKCCELKQRAGTLSQTPPSLTDFFTITNLCGYQQLNHYHNGDGTYSAFVNGGDGTVVATCYGADPNVATLSCEIALGRVSAAFDHLICYGHPCEPSTSSMGLHTSID